LVYDYGPALSDYGLDFTDSLVIEVYGRPYIQVPEYSGDYLDNGAMGLDPYEGFLTTTTTITSCTVPATMQPSLDAIASLDYGDYGVQNLTEIILIDELICSSRALAGLSTDRPGNLSRAFKIQYDAVNSKGLSAPPAYRLVAISPRCTAPEFWCSSLKFPRCSQYRSCALSSGFDPSSILASDNFVRSPSPGSGNTSPPVITLLGTGTVRFLSIGSWSGFVMIDYVAWGSNWVDPGAQAYGSPYGSPANLTSAILTSGALAVDTSVATTTPFPPNPPGYVVTYTVIDPATNKQYSARRYIYIVCPSSEKICVHLSTNTSICTTDGACINAKIGGTNQTGQTGF
jgi:hypothetical protein